MTPTELRNTNFEQLRTSLTERMLDVYRAFEAHGPCSTAQLAEKSGIGLLSVRPRAHDLHVVGLLCEAGERMENGKRATIYAITERATWQRWHAENFPADGQLQMVLADGHRGSIGALTT